MIPKIIHQVWIGDQSKRPQQYINTWKVRNKKWEHILWTEENLPKDLINQNKIDEIPEYCGKADIIRYELLHRYGGFAIDADAVCVKPLEDFLIKNDSFTCYENEQVRQGLLAVGYMGATQGNELMGHMVNEISQKGDLSNAKAWIDVGNLFFAQMVEKYQYNKIKIYPSYYFIPKHYTGVEYAGKGHVFAKQYWGSTFNNY
jgi:mannosyltransferase OCH1-like enzyme